VRNTRACVDHESCSDERPVDDRPSAVRPSEAEESDRALMTSLPAVVVVVVVAIVDQYGRG
jgi:hypothetical protein